MNRNRGNIVQNMYNRSPTIAPFARQQACARGAPRGSPIEESLMYRKNIEYLLRRSAIYIIPVSIKNPDTQPYCFSSVLSGDGIVVCVAIDTLFDSCTDLIVMVYLNVGVEDDSQERPPPGQDTKFVAR